MLKTSLPAKEHCDHIRKALAHQYELQKVISSLSRTTHGSAVGPSCITEKLQAAQAELDGLHHYFSSVVNPTFYNERLTGNHLERSPAERVFDIPEMLVLVLDYVPIRDLMSFQQVNRAAYGIIESSPELQRTLSLRADATGSIFRVPFQTWSGGPRGGFWCAYGTSGRILGNELRLTAGFSKATRLPRIGTRWRKMFICQPPVSEMAVSTACCAHQRNKDEPPNIIRSATGLTMGHLYDWTEALAAEHRMCINANVCHLDEDGFVNAKPTFATNVTLSEEDPILQTRRRLQSTRPVRNSTLRTRNERLQAYVKYKRQGT